MRIRLFILGILAGVAFINSCNDDLNLVGGSIRPDDDGHTARSDTFHIKASTFAADSVYARTIDALLGKMEDPFYGAVKSDYLFQFYCPENFRLAYTPKDANIDSVKLVLAYTGWQGDSIAPMTAQVYQVSKNLDRNFYSNVNPENYYNKSDLLATYTYTPRDFSITDSAWNVQVARKYYEQRITLPKEIGQKIYEATINTPEVFKNQDTFNEFFKGFYLTTDENSTGSFLQIFQTGMELYYQTDTVMKGSQGQDSAYVQPIVQTFTTTKEVIQLNRFDTKPNIDQLKQDTEHSYVMSPAGVYTELVIPTKTEGLIEKIQDRTINGLFFTIKHEPSKEWDEALTPPELLLLPKDSINVHFEKNRLTGSGYLAYLGTYNSTTRTYDFDNIANIVTVQMQKDPDNDIKMALVPVNVTTETNYNQTVLTGISPLFSLHGVQLITNEESMEFKITSTKFNADK